MYSIQGVQKKTFLIQKPVSLILIVVRKWNWSHFKVHDFKFYFRTYIFILHVSLIPPWVNQINYARCSWTLDKMPRLTEEHRIYCVEELIKTDLIVGTKRKLKTAFGIEVSRPALRALLKKWQTKGTTKNQNKKNSGRRRSARNEETIDTIEILRVTIEGISRGF